MTISLWVSLYRFMLNIMMLDTMIVHMLNSFAEQADTLLSPPQPRKGVKWGWGTSRGAFVQV